MSPTRAAALLLGEQSLNRQPSLERATASSEIVDPPSDVENRSHMNEVKDQSHTIDVENPLHIHNGFLHEAEDSSDTSTITVIPRGDARRLSDITNISVESLASQGPVPAQQRAQQQAVPNGKAGSPYTERQNPMNQQQQQQQVPAAVSSKNPKEAAAMASDMKNVVRRKLTGYVGFANLPNQWHRKSVRKGFNFNVMVVGKTPKNTDYISFSDFW